MNAIKADITPRPPPGIRPSHGRGGLSLLLFGNCKKGDRETSSPTRDAHGGGNHIIERLPGVPAGVVVGEIDADFTDVDADEAG